MTDANEQLAKLLEQLAKSESVIASLQEENERLKSAKEEKVTM